MKKNSLSIAKSFCIFLFLCIFAGVTSVASQTVDVTANAGTSATPVFGTSNYAASEQIYTETEIGAGNFLTAGTSINYIGFNVNTVGSPTTFNNVSIYMKNVPLATTAFVTGTYTNAGYTLVYSGSVTLATTGFTEILLTTPFVRTAGTNLQVLIERADGVTHPGFVYICANGNNTSSTALTARRYNSTAPLSGTTSLTVSTFRPAIRLARKYPNDAGVTNVYTLGKIPIPNGAPRIDSANVRNLGVNTLTNIPVTLTVSGANSFSDTQNIASLAPGANTVVNFASYTPTVEGTNTVTVSIPGDDFNGNNSNAVSQSVNKNTWSYAYGTTPSGGVGFNGATGDFVAKFSTAAPTSISQVSVNFFAGGQPYQIGIWDATGPGGTPGSNLYTSPTGTSTAGVNVLPVTPAVAIPAGDFFVGVRQTGTTNVSFAYQTESPIRTQTFYFTSPTGGTTWTDFAPANSFRFMIEPKLILATDASVSNLSLNTPSAVSCNTTIAPTIVVNNPGLNPIPPGGASVQLVVTGANPSTVTLSNTATIPTGASETLTFSGVNVSSPGNNTFTATVTFAGDLDSSNNSASTTISTARTLSNFPLIESFEAAALDIGYLSIVSGTRNLTSVQTGGYTNVDLGGTLNPFAGTKMILFDNYSGANSAGVRNRLYSECISIPAGGAGQYPYRLSYRMSHDASFSGALDKLFVTVSTDKGATWTPIGNVAGYDRYDAMFTVPNWRREAVLDLSPYAGQTIQVGFEDLSAYGNVIGLDYVQISGDGAQNIGLSTAANNGVALQRQLDDQGWTYYVDPADTSKTLFAIQWDPSNTGANASAKNLAIPRLQLDPALYSAEDIPTLRATYTMSRYWDVDLNGSTLTGPVNVRFFYDPAEKAAVTAAAVAFQTANGGTLKVPNWFKTRSGAFVPAINVTPTTVNDVIPLADANTTGATINGLTYAQFNGITSFSGGTWAAGVGLAPTAATASISGRITTAEGRGIRGAVLTVSGGDLSSPRIVRTGSLGYFSFEDLAVGQTYVLTVNSKRFVFSNPSRVITLSDNVGDADFVAEP